MYVYGCVCVCVWVYVYSVYEGDNNQQAWRICVDFRVLSIWILTLTREQSDIKQPWAIENNISSDGFLVLNLSFFTFLCSLTFTFTFTKPQKTLRI